MSTAYRPNAAERLWANTAIDPVSGCELWGGGLNSAGYGILTDDDGRQARTHRLVWEIAYGHIPDGPDGEPLLVLHRCDTPACVSLDHLWVGSKGQNNSDRHLKGRDARGTQHGMAKLTDLQVAAIRAAYTPRAPGVRGNAVEVALSFGVSASYVRRLCHGKYRRLSG